MAARSGKEIRLRSRQRRSVRSPRQRPKEKLTLLRFRLESELSGGAHHLRHMKQEIETSKQKLQPRLDAGPPGGCPSQEGPGGREQAQSAALIMVPLIIAYIIGLAMIEVVEKHGKPA